MQFGMCRGLKGGIFFWYLKLPVFQVFPVKFTLTLKLHPAYDLQVTCLKVKLIVRTHRFY